MSPPAGAVPPPPTAAPGPPSAARDAARHLDRTLLHSLAWSAGTRWLMQIVTWGSTIVVTRLLSPSDYGLVGLATLYMGFVTLVSELGFGSAIVALRRLSDDEVAQINAVSVLAGIGAFALSWVLAAPLGAFFGAPDLPRVLMVLATTFVITSFRAVPLALLQRELAFRDISVRDAIGAFAAAVCAIVMAWAGWRYWAIVGSLLVGAIVQTALTLQRRRHRFARPRFHALGEILRFGRRLVVGRLSWYVYTNADFFVAGRLLGQTALGGYTFAWTLTNIPTEKITALIGNVAPAFFSAVQHDRAQLRRYLLVIAEGLALVSVPACIGIGLTARELVPAVFGPQWAGVVPIVELLSIYTALRAGQPIVNHVLTVAGETRYLMWQGVVSALVFPLAFWLASRWGPMGIAAAWVAIYPVQLAIGLTRLFRTGVVTAGEYLRALRPAASGTLVMAAAVLALRAALPESLPLMARALAEVGAGAAAYLATMLTVHRGRVLHFVRMIRSAHAA